jgi:tetratricopeptide (TPR) repeat protein
LTAPEGAVPADVVLDDPADSDPVASTSMDATEDHEAAKRWKVKSRSRSKPESEKDFSGESFGDPSEGAEVDLSIVLDDLEQAFGGETRSTEDAPSEGLGNVFARLRTDASRRSSGDESAEEQYRNGVALHEAGQDDEAIVALEAASMAPRLRFATASLVGRIHRKRGMTQKAIEWFERAAETPPPTADAGRQLLYDLADALESVGDVSRALAICMELYAEAGHYRDVSVRVDRLAKAQARG